MEIEVKGLLEAIQELDEKAKKAYPALKDVMLEVAGDIAEQAARNAPVRTGRLRASIEAVGTQDGAKVVAEAPYAGFVEYGTRKMTGRAYLGKAVEEVADRVYRKYEAEMIG